MKLLLVMGCMFDVFLFGVNVLLGVEVVSHWVVIVDDLFLVEVFVITRDVFVIMLQLHSIPDFR
jgi:hypothetical protein